VYICECSVYVSCVCMFRMGGYGGELAGGEEGASAKERGICSVIQWKP